MVALVALVGLVALLSSREEATLDARGTAPAGPGVLEPDLGARHGERADRSDPLPTSGPHDPVDLERDGIPLPPDGLLHALELGNVVIAYPGSSAPPAELTALRDDIAGEPSRALVRAGQAILVAPGREAGGPIEALAWRRRLITNDATDPRLRAFAEAWLGVGAGSSAP